MIERCPMNSHRYRVLIGIEEELDAFDFVQGKLQKIKITPETLEKIYKEGKTNGVNFNNNS